MTPTKKTALFAALHLLCVRRGCSSRLATDVTACKAFTAGLCPGPASCMCTTSSTCPVRSSVNITSTHSGSHGNYSDAGSLRSAAGACTGQCRAVLHGKCKGGNGCLFDAGPCTPAPPSPPSPPRIQGPIGPDVSHYQGAVNWSEVKATGAGFGICKATEGTGYRDDQFAANWGGMRAAGFTVRGAYHFGHPGESAAAQASLFVKTVGHVGKGEFLILDIEAATRELAAGNWTDQTPQQVVAWCVSFVSSVVAQSGVTQNKMWIYTGEWFWGPDAGGSAALGKFPLWISSYTTSPPPPAQGWSRWRMWQFTDKGSFHGIGGAVDTSVFRGTQAQLETLVA